MKDIFDLELSEVSKRFGTFVAVDRFSLQVQRGEFVTLLGPSGCGKTTTLRMVAGLITPDEGQIFIRGKDVGEVPTFKRNIGMVFQNYALFPHLTVAENIGFGLAMRKFNRNGINERVEQALRLVQLSGLGHRYPRQLSGGQQQRVATARALAIEPSLLLLDEPLSNLDLKLRQQMRLELKQIQRDLNITTIFVTHDQEEAMVMSDRIALLEAGRIEQIGTPHEVYRNPANRFVAGFLGESNFFSAKVDRIVGGGIIQAVLTSGIMVRARAPHTVHEGQSVSLTVRPERIRITRGEGTQTNRVSGTIHEAIFSGSLTRYHVQISGGGKCIIEQQSGSGDTAATKGQQVWMEWAAEDCLVLPEDHSRVR